MRPRILVVDDDFRIVQGIIRVLKMEEIDADGATSSIEAEALLERKRFDTAILDIAMPGGDGVELCRRIRANNEISRLPVLYLTGSDDNPTMERAFAAGGDDYILKPFRVRDLLARIKAAVERRRAMRDLDDAESVLMSLARSVEAKDRNTAGHCDRLAQMTVALGRRLDLSDGDLEALRKGSVLHDIGKISTPDAILQKSGPLTLEEREVMKAHAAAGAHLVAPLRTMTRAHPIVRHHHERFDGSGYPDGLAGEKIPRLARIFQVCDIFDALTSARPYKPALPIPYALELLKEETRSGWCDPDVVRVFVEMNDEH